MSLALNSAQRIGEQKRIKEHREVLDLGRFFVIYNFQDASWPAYANDLIDHLQESNSELAIENEDLKKNLALAEERQEKYFDFWRCAEEDHFRIILHLQQRYNTAT
ncbi:hypothetical protein FACUT_6494 [Fusarium acutatum]|uniref:Uncharacterized protein n=1 Tax=Fusarium acutatum TaxID=78861 RepID=A0A8H4JP28_9HYPO|nr:hypothetical protein FACUT_6494 [Fusarium acutatum]